MKPIFAAAREHPPERSASSSPKARTSACCARCRPWSTRGWRAPILIGRPAVIERAIHRYGLRIRIGEHFTVVNPEHDARYREYWQEYHRLTRRNGVTAQYAKLEMRRRTTLIGAMLLRKGEADGLICGTISTTARHLRLHRPGYRPAARSRRLWGHVRPHPAGAPAVHRRYARQSSSDAPRACGNHCARRRAAARVRPRPEGRARCRIRISASSDAPSALKMRAVLALLSARMPELEVDGEMHGDCALDEAMPQVGASRLDPRRQRQSARVSRSGQCQHRLQPAEVCRRQ